VNEICSHIYHMILLAHNAHTGPDLKARGAFGPFMQYFHMKIDPILI